MSLINTSLSSEKICEVVRSLFYVLLGKKKSVFIFKKDKKLRLVKEKNSSNKIDKPDKISEEENGASNIKNPKKLPKMEENFILIENSIRNVISI